MVTGSFSGSSLYYLSIIHIYHVDDTQLHLKRLLRNPSSTLLFMRDTEGGFGEALGRITI